MRKPLILLYFLLFYAFAQLLWWGILLIRHEPELKAMIVGEGIFFFSIFFFVVMRMKRVFVREHKLQMQQRNFLLAITHELKSPLASIKLYIQTILKRDLEKEQREQFLNNSLKDIERLDDLVENVLIATQLESFKPNFPKEEINFSELVMTVLSRLQTGAGATHQIDTKIQGNVKIHADRFSLTNAVSNLIENALKYSPKDGGKVEVSLWEIEDQIFFTVSDNGDGIPQEERKNIFNKFYRVGNEGTRKTKGTGLGLYIVKTVLDKHHAQITVKDNEPKGTLFEVIFNAYATK